MVVLGMGLIAPESVACISLPCVRVTAAFTLAQRTARQLICAAEKKIHAPKPLAVGLALCLFKTFQTNVSLCRKREYGSDKLLCSV